MLLGVAVRAGVEEGLAMGEANAVIAVDVDGVLVADPRRTNRELALRAAGYEPHEFDGLGPDDTPASGVGPRTDANAAPSTT